MVLLGACGSSDDESSDSGSGSAEASNVTLRVGDLGSGNQTRALLEASGEADDLPYEIEWSTFPAGPQLLEAQRAGSVDIGYMATTPVIFAQAAQTPVKIVAVHKIEDSESSDTAVLVPEDSPIQEVTDLKGNGICPTEGSRSAM